MRLLNVRFYNMIRSCLIASLDARSFGLAFLYYHQVDHKSDYTLKTYTTLPTDHLTVTFKSRMKTSQKNLHIFYFIIKNKRRFADEVVPAAKSCRFFFRLQSLENLLVNLLQLNFSLNFTLIRSNWLNKLNKIFFRLSLKLFTHEK